jgi:DNA primase
MNKLLKKYKSADSKINYLQSFVPNGLDIGEFLDVKGIKYFDNGGKWLKMNCILPYGHIDNSPSFFINKESGAYNCYCCGSGNWGSLLKAMDWEVEYENILMDIMHNSIWKDTLNLVKKIPYTQDREKSYPVKTYKKIKIDTNNEFTKYLRDRNIFDKIISRFELGYSNEYDNKYKSNYVNKVLIPVYNTKGKFLWMEGRSIYKEKHRYFRPFGIIKTKYLFNYHRAKENKKYVIVVEGIIDAMILWIYGLNSVCCFGSVISEDQFALLSIFDEIIICLDNDAAGIKGWLKVKKKINESMLAGSLISRIVMPRNIDVNLLNSKKKFKKLFRNRKFYTDSYKTENRN